MEERRDKLGRRINPNSLKNLKPCKKGETHNPKGGPRREASLTRIARGMLPKVCPYDSKGRTWGEYLAERWMAESISNASYFKELMDRLEGKVTQPIATDGEVILKVVYDDVKSSTP